MSKLLRTLLFLTPIGYAITIFDLHLGRSTPGVFVHLPQKKPPKVIVKKNYLAKDRWQWFFNGLLLVAQAYFVANNNFKNPTKIELVELLLAVFIWMALLFGIVNVFTALHPKLKWEQRIFSFIDFNWLWLVIIFTLIIGTGCGFLAGELDI